MPLPLVQAALAIAGSGSSKGLLEVCGAFLRFEWDLKSSREEETTWSGSKKTGCALNLEIDWGLLVHLGTVKTWKSDKTLNSCIKMYITTDENLGNIMSFKKEGN